MIHGMAIFFFILYIMKQIRMEEQWQSFSACLILKSNTSSLISDAHVSLSIIVKHSLWPKKKKKKIYMNNLKWQK